MGTYFEVTELANHLAELGEFRSPTCAFSTRKTVGYFSRIRFGSNDPRFDFLMKFQDTNPYS